MPVLVRIEFFAIHVFPPRFIAGEIVEVIPRLAELDGIEYASLVERGQSRFLVSESATSLNLHVCASRVCDDRPADCRQVIENRFVYRCGGRPGIKAVAEVLLVHHTHHPSQCV